MTTEKLAVDERPGDNSIESSTVAHPSPAASRRSSANSPQFASYHSTTSGLVLMKPTNEGPIPVDLTNFAAEIVEDILKDDGVETCRFYKIKASLVGRRFSFNVPAERFASMAWATEHMGASAIVHPGRADYARTAIQILSRRVVERQVFGHTGW